MLEMNTKGLSISSLEMLMRLHQDLHLLGWILSLQFSVSSTCLLCGM
jgi:hypothetical protein